MKLKEGTKDYPNKWWETDHRQKTKPRMIGGAFKQKKKERDSSDVHDLQRYMELTKIILSRKNVKEEKEMPYKKDDLKEITGIEGAMIGLAAYHTARRGYEKYKQVKNSNTSFIQKTGEVAKAAIGEPLHDTLAMHKKIWNGKSQKPSVTEEGNTSPGVETIELPDRYEGKYSVRNVYMNEWIRKPKSGNWKSHRKDEMGREPAQTPEQLKRGRHAAGLIDMVQRVADHREKLSDAEHQKILKKLARLREETENIDESRNLPITDGPPGQHKPSKYKYLGVHGDLHIFQEPGGPKEGFAKRKPGSGDAGWHIKRGAHVYEFASSYTVKEDIEQLDETSKRFKKNYVKVASAKDKK